MHADARHCTSVEQDASGVSVTFSDGPEGAGRSTLRGRAAIACDGINSAIRKLIISGNHDVDELQRLARESGLTSMAENGLQYGASAKAAIVPVAVSIGKSLSRL